MRTLKDTILEKLSIDNINFDTLDENLIKKYKLVYNQKTGCYDCEGNINIKDDLIEDGHFICDFGIVKGSFDCSVCVSLETLEGAPKEVGKHFDCSSCSSLKTLKGAPIKVRGSFYCDHSNNLKTLEGAPKEVGGDFVCSYCNSLESLEGAPEEVGKDFYCRECKKLRTIKNGYDIDTKIGGSFIK